MEVDTCSMAERIVAGTRLLAIRMALVLRRTTHVGLEIRGCTVAQWTRRKQRKMEAREHLRQPFTPGLVDSEGAVHFSAASSATSRGGEAAIDVRVGGSNGPAKKNKHSSVHCTISVDITQTS